MADPLYWLTVVHFLIISVLSVIVSIYKADQEINCGKYFDIHINKRDDALF